MFVVSSTAYGVSQRLLAFAQMAQALARAETAVATATDRSKIYRVASAQDSHEAVSVVGVGKGVYVDAVTPVAPTPVSEAARAQIVQAQVLSAMNDARNATQGGA